MENFIVAKLHGNKCTIVLEEINYGIRNPRQIILDVQSREMLLGVVSWTARQP